MTEFAERFVPILEALCWIETRDFQAVKAFRERPGASFDDLFGVDPAALLYPETAKQSRAKARADLGWTSVEKDPVGALLREVRTRRLEMFGRTADGGPLEQIPGLQWSEHGGLRLKPGVTGLAAFWPGKSESPAFVWLSVDTKQLLRLWPQQDAKRRGRPPTKGPQAAQAIEALREGGVNVSAMGDKALARELRTVGVVVSPRTVGRKRRAHNSP